MTIHALLKELLIPQNPCELTRSNVNQCAEEESGELRGRVLSHMIEKGHLGGLSKLIEEHISKVENKQQFRQELLASKEQLPPFYLISRSDKPKFVKTEEYLDLEASKVERTAVRIETLQALNVLFGSMMEKAQAVQAKLVELNDKAPSAADLQDFRETLYAELQEAKRDLQVRVQEIARNATKKFISGNSFITIVNISPQSPEAVGTLKAAKFFDSFSKEFSSYDVIFEKCLAGIETKAGVAAEPVDVAAGSDELASSSDSDISSDSCMSSDSGLSSEESDEPIDQ